MVLLQEKAWNGTFTGKGMEWYFYRKRHVMVLLQEKACNGTFTGKGMEWYFYRKDFGPLRRSKSNGMTEEKRSKPIHSIQCLNYA